MAEFIIGSPLRNLARQHEPLRQLLWRVDFVLIWTLLKLLQALPIDLSSRVGSRLGYLIGGRMKGKSAIFRQNLAIAFPEKGDDELNALVRQSWSRAGRILAEYSHLETIFADPERLQIKILEPVETYENPSRPSVFISAHQSNWEVVCPTMAKLGIPNASLYSPPTNPLLDKLLMESRYALNSKLLPRDNSARSLVRALKEGRSIAMIIDRRVDEGKPIAFFGRDKPSTIVPAKLALKFNCDLVPVKIERLKDARFQLTFQKPIRPNNPEQDETAQAIDMTRQAHQQFEGWIREKPEDWFCSKRLWPKGTLDSSMELRPEADVDSYAN